MAYYYTVDNNDYFTNWSVGAEFAGCIKLPDGVAVPEPLKTCSCNVRAYKYTNGVITYDPERADVSDLYVPAGGDGKDGKDGKDGISCTHSWNGTVLTVTSASGTSSADLKGEKGESGGAAAFKPQMIMQTIEGVTVTCTLNGVAIEGKQYGAIWLFEFPAFGYYVFTYDDGTTQSVEGLYVDTVKEYRKVFKSGYGYYTANTEYLYGIDWTQAQNKLDEFYMRDPFVMLCDDVYFMYGSNIISPALGNKGFSCYISADKENWSYAYDITAGAVDWTGYENFWSPELIYRNGWFYMVASCRKTGEKKNGLMMLAATSPFGKFYNISDAGFADGFFTDIENHNYVEPHFWQDANVHCFYTESNNRHDETSAPDVIYTSRLNSGLTAFETQPYKILSADQVSWATSDVCTAAFVLKDYIGEYAIMLFCADTANGRAIGQAHARGSIAGEWIVDDTPLLVGDVGQASIFIDRQGKMMMAYHTPNTADYSAGIVEHAQFIEVEADTANGWLRIKR